MTDSMSLVAEKEARSPSFSIPYSVRQHALRFGIIIAVFAIGVAGVFLNSIYSLRIALASSILLVLVRYNYILLISWVLLNGPNSLPLFRGSNIIVGLTIPTLLAMACMPIKQTIKRLPALGWLCIFLLWSALTIGISPFGTGPTLTAWFLRLDCALVSILAINALSTRRRLVVLIDTMLLMSTAIALYGLYSFLTKQNGVVDPTTSLFRTSSIFSTATGLSLFLSLVIPLAVYRTFTLQGLKRIVGVLLILLFVLVAGLTFTRSTYLSVPVSLLIMVFFVPSREMRNALLCGLSLLAVLVILLGTIGNVPIFSRFFNQDIGTLNGRTYLWQTILDNFDPTQVLGKGLRASDALLTNLFTSGINANRLTAGLTSSHDLFLGTLYDHGIIGLLLLILVFMALVTSIIGGVRKSFGERRLLFAVALAVLASVLLQSLDSNDFWNQAISIYIWIILMLPFAVYWSKQQPPPTEISMNRIPRWRMQAIQQRAREQTPHVWYEGGNSGR